MKSIRILRNTGAGLPHFTEGQVVGVPDETADMLCGLKLAVLLKTIPVEPLRAIPAASAIVADEDSSQEPSKPKRQYKTKSDPKE